MDEGVGGAVGVATRVNNDVTPGELIVAESALGVSVMRTVVVKSKKSSNEVEISMSTEERIVGVADGENEAGMEKEVKIGDVVGVACSKDVGETDGVDSKKAEVGSNKNMELDVKNSETKLSEANGVSEGEKDTPPVAVAAVVVVTGTLVNPGVSITEGTVKEVGVAAMVGVAVTIISILVVSI